MGVSENNGTPKSSILIQFSFINHPFWGTPIFGNPIWSDEDIFQQIECPWSPCFWLLHWMMAAKANAKSVMGVMLGEEHLYYEHLESSGGCSQFSNYIVRACCFLIYIWRHMVTYGYRGVVTLVKYISLLYHLALGRDSNCETLRVWDPPLQGNSPLLLSVMNAQESCCDLCQET